MKTSGFKRIGIVLIAILIIAFSALTITACNSNSEGVTEISVVTESLKGYYALDEFDISQIQLLVTYESGNTNVISAEKSMLTKDGQAAIKEAGSKTITLYYKTKTATVDLFLVEDGASIISVKFTDVSGNEIACKYGLKGGAIEAPEAPKVENQVFVAWVDVTTGEKFDLKKVDDSATVSASYSGTKVAYTVKFFDHKGAELSSVTKTEGSKVVAGDAPSFNVAKKYPELESFVWSESFPITVNRDITVNLVPTYKTYSVMFAYAVSGEDDYKYLPVEYNTRVQHGTTVSALFSSAQKWFTDNGYVVESEPGDSKTITQDTTFKFVVSDPFIKIKVYRDGDKKDTCNDISVKVGTKFTFPEKTEAAVVTNKLFKQWKLVGGDEDDVFDAGKEWTVKPENGVTLLEFVPIYVDETFTVTFKLNFTNVTEEDLTYMIIYPVNLKAKEAITQVYIDNLLEDIKNNEDAYEAMFNGQSADSGINVNASEASYNGQDVTVGATTLGKKAFENGFANCRVLETTLKVNGETKHITANEPYYVTTELEVLVTIGEATDGLVYEVIKETVEEKETVVGYRLTGFTGNGKVNIYIPDTYTDGTENGTAPVKEIIADLSGKMITRIPATVEKIGSYVFKDAYIYGDVNLPNLKEIGTGAFTGATLYGNMTFGNLEVLGESAFENAVGENSIVINLGKAEETASNAGGEASALTEIKANTFKKVTGVSEIIIPATVTDIGTYAFYACKAEYVITEDGTANGVLTLPAVKRVGENAFSLTEFTGIDLPALIEIGTNAFENMEKLQSISLATATGDGEALNLDATAFTGCLEIVSVTIGKGINGITNPEVFGTMEKLAEITVSQDNTAFYGHENVLYMKEGTVYTLCYYPNNKQGEYKASIPADGSLVLLPQAFDYATVAVLDLTGIENITVAGGTTLGNVYAVIVKEELVSSIETGLNSKVYTSVENASIAYDSEYELVYEIVGTETKTVKVIGGNRYSESITVPSTLGGISVTTVGEGAFEGFENLTTLNVEAVIDGWNETILNGCSALTEFNVAGWQENTVISVSDFAGNAWYNAHNVIYIGNKLIGYNNDAYDLTGSPITVVTAEDVKAYFGSKIEENFFFVANENNPEENVCNITEITIPSTITIIGNNAFKGCKYLKTVVFEGTLDTLGANAFASCIALSEIEISFGNATSSMMGESVFKNCASLETAVINGGVNYITAGAVDYYRLPVGTFYNCTSLRSVAFEKINRFSQDSKGVSEAFYNCSALTEFDFSIIKGDTIPMATFSGSGLKYIDFTKATNIKTVSASAFSGSALEYVKFAASITKVDTASFDVDNLIVEIPYGNKTGLYTSMDSVSSGAFAESAVFYYSKDIIDTSTNFLGSVAKKYSDYPVVAVDFLDDIMEEGTVLQMSISSRKLFFTEADLTPPTYVGYAFAGWFTASETTPITYTPVEFPMVLKTNGTIKLFAKYYKEKQGLLESSDIDYIYYLSSAPELITENENDNVVWYYTHKTTMGESEERIAGWPLIVHKISYEDEFNIYAIINGGETNQEIIEFGDIGEKGYAIIAYTQTEVVIPDVYDDENNGEDEIILVYAGAFAKDGVNIAEYRLPSYTKAIKMGYYDGGSLIGGVTFNEEMESVIIPASVEYIEDGVFTSPTLKNITFEEGSKLVYASAKAFYGSAWWYAEFEKAISNNGFIKAGSLALQYVGKGTPVVISDENKINNSYIIRTENVFGFVNDDLTSEITLNIGFYADEFLGNHDVLFTKSIYNGTVCWSGEATIEGARVSFVFAFDADVNVSGDFVAVEGSNVFTFDTVLDVKALMVKTVYENEVTLPAGIVKLNDNIFMDNKELKTLVVNKELVYVGDNALNGSGLEEIRYGETNTEQYLSVVSQIGKSAFINTKWYEERENVVLGKIYLKFNNISGTEIVTIRDKITTIASGAFKGVTVGTVDLASVDTLTTIKSYAFMDSNINRIVLPKSVTDIGRGVFMNCTNLSTADLSSVVLEVLPQETFKNATSLKTLLLNNSVKTFGKDSLAKCISLSMISANGITEIAGLGDGANKFECGLEDTAWYKNGTDESEFLTLGTVLVRFIETPIEGPVSDNEEDKQKTITIAEGITSIAQYAFASNLDERFTYTIVISNSVKSIGESAFADKTNIKEVVFGTGLEVIGKRAFYGCSELVTAILPESLTKIEALAFYGTSLTSVVKDEDGVIVSDEGYTIPDSVTEIGEGAFENVLTLTSINLGSKIEMIENRAFYSENGGLYKVNWNLDINVPEVVDINEIPLSPADKFQKNMATRTETEPDFIPSTIFVSANAIRFYATEDVTQYVNNTYKIWGPHSQTNNGGYGWNFYEHGNFPLISFTNDNYNIQAFNSEYIKEGDISIPVHDTDASTTYTFMGWEVVLDAESGAKSEFSYPFAVYQEITLDAKWYRNTAYPMLGGSVNTEAITENSEISCDDGSKIVNMTIDTTAGTVIINKITLGSADQSVLYLPSKVSNDNGSGSANAVSYSVIGFSENLQINAPAGSGIDTTENRISQIEEIVLTDAANFNGMSENIFSAFTGLKRISVYTTDSEKPDYKIVPVEFTAEEDGKSTTHTFYVVYTNDTASNTNFGTKLIAFIGNINDAIPVDEETGEKLNSAVYDFVFEIPQGVTEICSKALVNSGFKTISLPNTITKIGDNAFGKELAKLRISRNIYLNNVKFEAFDIDSPIRKNEAKYVSYSNYIEIESIQTYYTVSGSDYGKFYSLANVLLGYETGITRYSEFTIPDEINGFAITVIGESIYLGKITQNGLGESEIVKDDESKIETAYLTLPANLIKINAHAFDGFDITTSVTYTGNSLTDMDGNVFGECSFYTQSNGAMYLGKILVKWNDATGNVTVDNGTVSISSNAFNGSTATKITLPESLINIADNAFYGSTNLREINIPNSVTKIGASAFQNCSALTTVTIDTINSNLDSIGNNVFFKCKSLKQLRLPYNLTSIGENAFSACSSLTTITFDGYREVITEQNTVEYVLDTDKLSKLTYLGASAFSENSSLTEISIPNGVTEIQKSTFVSCTSLVYVNFDVTNSKLEKIGAQAFMGCSKLGSVLTFDANDEDSLTNVNPITLNLPNKLVKVEEQAFQSCSGLWGVQFNYNILEIGNNAFSGCDSLIKVNIFRSTVPTIYNNTFTPEGSKYRLRIYVNIGENRAIVKKYESAWPALKGYIHEREEKPTVKYLNNQNEVSSEVQGEIIISPSAVIDGNTVLATELQFYKFEAYVDVAGVGVESTRELRDVTETCVGSRSGKRISEYTTPYVQGDQAGYMHTDGKVYTILVLDYEIITLKKTLA